MAAATPINSPTRVMASSYTQPPMAGNVILGKVWEDVILAVSP
jgi:hypothetical protein